MPDELTLEDIKKAVDKVRQWEFENGYGWLTLTHEQVAAIKELPKTLPEGATLTVNGETFSIITTKLKPDA